MKHPVLTRGLAFVLIWAEKTVSRRREDVKLCACRISVLQQKLGGRRGGGNLILEEILFGRALGRNDGQFSTSDVTVDQNREEALEAREWIGKVCHTTGERVVVVAIKHPLFKVA